MTQPLEIVDFSGGITDFFLDGQPNQAQTLDNLFVDPNRKVVTRPGSELFVAEQLPTGQEIVHHLEILNGTVLAFSENKVFFDDTGWTEIQGPAADPLFPTETGEYYLSTSEWQDQLFIAHDQFPSPQKIYADENGDLQVRNAGLPELPAGFSVANPTGSGNSYLYAAIFVITYQVGDVTFVDRGPSYIYPTVVTGGAITGGNPAAVTLPTALADDENWKVVDFDIEVYRTVNGGTTFFKTSTQNFGTANFNDTTTDAALLLNEPLYTNGGIASNGTPPKAKFVHVVNDIGYYGFVEAGGSEDRYTVLQSKPGDPDSVPYDFITYIEHEIRSVSSIFDRPMVLSSTAIYRIDNFIDAQGQGNMDVRRIDDNAGCVSAKSVVRTHMGLFWAGAVGFYWSDGFKVQKISDHLPNTYRVFVENAVKAKNISGTYDPTNERVVWSVNNEGPGSLSNQPNSCISLELKFGVSAKSTFTTLSGGDSFKPTAILIKDEVIYRGDTRGFVFYHTNDFLSDIQLNLNETPANWIHQPIIYDLKSIFYDFGSKFMRKFVPRILVSANNRTNLSLQINSSNDKGRVTSALVPIRYKNAIAWGDTLPVWGDPDPIWDYQGLIEEWRRFPSGGLRCQYKQVQFTNAYVEIITSTVFGDVTVNSILKTATLAPTLAWLDEMTNYYISFENDNYTKEFLITSRDSNQTVAFDDPESASPADGDYAFKVRGITKDEVLELNGYVIHWMYLSKTQLPYISGSLSSIS